MAINVSTVMDGLGVRLATITGLRVFDFVPDGLSPPAAVVAYPESVDYDETYARGVDRCIIPVTVVVGKVSDRASRDALGAYLAGTGASSVKAAIDGTLGGAVDAARVASADVSTITISSVEYIGAIFRIEVWD